MNRRDFWAVLAGAGVACSRRRTAVSLAELAPPDSTMMVGARLDALRKTQTYQRHFEGLRFEALDDFAQKYGVQVDRDVDDLVYASNGREYLLLARGRFDKKGGLAFLEDGTALSGSPGLIETVTRRAAKPTMPEALAIPMQDVGGDAQFWAVFTGGAARLPVPDSSNLGNVNTILRTVSTGSFTADLSRGLNARARVLCAAESDARNMGDALKALLAIGKAASSKKPDLARAYESIRVTVEGRRVSASADAPQELVERLVQAFGK
jgi:hypothetical protein